MCLLLLVVAAERAGPPCQRQGAQVHAPQLRTCHNKRPDSAPKNLSYQGLSREESTEFYFLLAAPSGLTVRRSTVLLVWRTCLMHSSASSTCCLRASLTMASNTEAADASCIRLLWLPNMGGITSQAGVPLLGLCAMGPLQFRLQDQKGPFMIPSPMIVTLCIFLLTILSLFLGLSQPLTSTCPFPLPRRPFRIGRDQTGFKER